MVSKGRETIPPLPAEGRTSMDLPRDAERDFYAAIGYLPLGDHAIRADMVERLAAMARQAVRESREAARRAQHEKQHEKQHDKKTDEPATAAVPPAPAAAEGEISEWAIVAAAFGEVEPAPEPAPPPEAVVQAEPIVEEAPKIEEAAPAVAEEASSEVAAVEEGEAEEAKPEEAKAEEVKVEGVTAEESKLLRPLAPGHFRATPQMMSLVGCSEPEMANVLRGLGYRVHVPSDETGPLHSFSVKPRFVREREEQRERQRQQERERRDQRRRERPERPNERQFFADSPQRGEPRHDGAKDAPRSDGPRPDRAKAGPREDRPREERRGPRPPRRDTGGPALRLYATTEKKGDAAADSPFAKLLELKLGGKK
jgi:ATP-dependent RNA helicase SUPV3L1/SUV3